RDVTIPADAAVSTPYWLAERSLAGRQVVSDPRLVGEPTGPPALAVAIELEVEHRIVRLTAPVVYAWTDPVEGERTRPMLVMPPATVTPARQAVLAPNGTPAPAVLRVRAAQDDLRGDVTLGVPEGWLVTPDRASVALAHAGDEATVRFDVTPPPQATPVEIKPAIEVGGRRWGFREDVVDHPHIPMQVVLQPASLRLVPLALELPAGRVGYVPGPGDTIAEDLAHVGMSVEVLDPATIGSADLGRFAAIAVGSRAYNTRSELRQAHARLMAYVEQGGTVVVQYNTN